MKALIVDDDKYVRMGLQKLISWDEMQFSEVLYAENGATAYETFVKAHPDFVITDVRMPIMNGIELCKKISESGIETIIIILSAYDEFEYARAALSYDVNEYILKPLDEARVKQLNEKIKLIVSEQKSKKNIRKIIYSKEWADRVTNSLHESDIDDISELFHQELAEMHLDQTDTKDCCLLLIDLLFKHLEKIGYQGNELLAQKRVNSIEHVLNTKTHVTLLEYILDLYIDMLESKTTKSPETNLLVNEMGLYVHENYKNPDLNVKKISDDLHLSAGYAGPLFKKYKGITLNTFINNLRIEKSCKLLEDISLNVSTVGQRVGIPDTNYFCKLFKKIKGITPTEYRNIRLKN